MKLYTDISFDIIKNIFTWSFYIAVALETSFIYDIKFSAEYS